MGEGQLGIVVEKNVDVPMRDGVLLRANVFRPAGDGRYPGLLLRTPYGKPEGGMERYVRAGYAVVTQDSRGRYASEGEHVPFTEEETGDAEDGYDAVEWLAAQPYCNGRVGTFGASYNAWMQWQLAKLRPPHLVAMCAYTIPLELTEVDWPGAFKPGRRIKWWRTTIAPDLRRREGAPKPHTPAEARKLWDEVEQGYWLGLMPWKEIAKYLPEQMAYYVESWLAEPNRRPWKFADIHAAVEVPNLDFSGWYDHCNGTMAHLGLMQKNARTAAAKKSQLVVGPWNHPGLGKRQLGDIDFGPQAELDLTAQIIRWFDHWLKGLDNGVAEESAVRYFCMGKSGGWRSAATWPPENGSQKTYHLHSAGDAQRADGGGYLHERAPAGKEPADLYVYDPRDPVPTLWTPDHFTVPADRRALECRSDILYYQTAPLQEEIEVVGYPEAVLYAASSAPDTDFFARLVDEDPQGRALEICYGMVRARHRHSFDEEELLVPGEVVEYRIKLGATACRFAKGHRIRLEITSSDFPNHDRNHNVGRNDLEDVEMAVAEQRVLHEGEHASRLVLPVSE
jgi:uncharacterized protein